MSFLDNPVVTLVAHINLAVNYKSQVISKQTLLFNSLTSTICTEHPRVKTTQLNTNSDDDILKVDGMI